jgi:hypothetical protein
VFGLVEVEQLDLNQALGVLDVHALGGLATSSVEDDLGPHSRTTRS